MNLEIKLRHQDDWHQVGAAVLLSSSYSRICLIEVKCLNRHCQYRPQCPSSQP